MSDANRELFAKYGYNIDDLTPQEQFQIKGEIKEKEKQLKQGIKEKEKQLKKGIKDENKKLNEFLNGVDEDVSSMISAGEDANKEVMKTAENPPIIFGESSADAQKRYEEEIIKKLNDVFNANRKETDISMKEYFKNNIDKYYDIVREVEKMPEGHEKRAKKKRLQEFIAYRPIDVDKFQPAGQTQQQQNGGDGGTQQENDDGKPQTSQKEDEDNNWSGLSFNGIPTQEDIDDAYSLAREGLSKEKKSAQQFYSRIFSVPEWFPKGLDEFREAKRKYTAKYVYDKKSGKYEKGKGSYAGTWDGETSFNPDTKKFELNEKSPAVAKKEMKLAKQVVDGIEGDIDKLETSIEEQEKALPEWGALSDKEKGEYVKRAENQQAEMRQKINRDFISLINQTEENGRNITPKEFWDKINDSDIDFVSQGKYKTKEEAINAEQGNYDKALDELKKQANNVMNTSPKELAEQIYDDEKYTKTFDPIQNKYVIDAQRDAINALKNGNLADANKEVDRLQKVFEETQEKFQSDKENYRAAKRKLIKENAGDIARNIWLIIDLVTTMNRNMARMVPQGKYSPNLGNFETPALFQDYAEQLKGIRETYNKANEKALMNNIDLEALRGKGAIDAQSSMYALLPQRYKNYIDNEAYIKRAWTDEAVKEALLKAQQELNIDFEDTVAKNNFLRNIRWAGGIWNGLSAEEQKNYYMLNVALAENKDKIALGAMKSLLVGTDKDKWETVLENIGKSGLNSIKSNEDKIRWMNNIDIIQGCIECVDKAALTAEDILGLVQGAVNPLKWLDKMGKNIKDTEKAEEIKKRLREEKVEKGAKK